MHVHGITKVLRLSASIYIVGLASAIRVIIDNLCPRVAMHVTTTCISYTHLLHILSLHLDTSTSSYSFFYIYHTMASSLRRRIFGGDTTPEITNDSSPKAEAVQLAPVSKILTRDKEATAKKSSKRKTGLIFFLGGLFGIIAAGYFAEKNDLIPELGDMSMQSVLDVLPAGMASELRAYTVRISPRVIMCMIY